MKKRTSAYRRSMAVVEATAEHSRPKDALDGLAEYLRELFYTHLQFYVEISYVMLEQRAKSEHKAWRKLAAHLVARLIPPREFILAQFSRLGQEYWPRGPCTPKQLLSARCLQRYEQYADDQSRLKEMCLRIGGQIERVREGIVLCQFDGETSVADARVEVLNDERTDLDSLFRYVLARIFAEEYPSQQSDFNRIAAKHKATAVVEYITHRDLVDQSPLKRLLPEDFVENAAQDYMDIYGLRPSAR